MTGEELKQKLTVSGKTQKEIAQLLDVTPQALTVIFHSKDVKTGTLEKMAKVLGVSMSFFYPEPETTINNQYVRRAKNVTNSGDIKEGSDNSAMVQQLLDQNAALIKIIQGNLDK